MSNLVFEADPRKNLGGTVLRSTKGSQGILPTGVFLPDAGFILGDNQSLTVLLWFHGYYVQDVEHLFFTEATHLIQAVAGSGRRIVLVAPWLGWFQDKKHSSYSPGALGGGTNTEQYLDQVLAALYDWYLTSTGTSTGTGTSTSTGTNVPVRPPGGFQIADLYVAGHSGGGDAIVSSVGALGRYTEKLRECWGFDCLYGSGQAWYQWARSQQGLPLYFYYGTGTKPAFNGDVLGFWRPVYGTLKKPLPLGSRMLNVYLAPALPGTELDIIAFQNAVDIQAKARPSNRYEEVRKKVDPLLDDDAAYWTTLMAEGLKDHYAVVSELLGPRISQSIL